MSKYSIEIHPILNGWVVKVGCQLVAYRDRAELVEDLDHYLRDPKSMETRFMKTKAVNPVSVPMPTPESAQCEAPSIAIPDIGRVEGLLRRG
jgi:hypothetical protein